MNEDFNFHYELTVRWSEIDAMQFVYNAHYLTYLDIASTEYFKTCIQGDLSELVERDEFDFVLVKSTLEFKAPARLWDRLKIYCRTKRLGNKSFTMEFVITKSEDESIILKAEIIYSSFSKKENKAVPLPEFVRRDVQAFEKGELSE